MRQLSVIYHHLLHLSGGVASGTHGQPVRGLRGLRGLSVIYSDLVQRSDTCSVPSSVHRVRRRSRYTYLMASGCTDGLCDGKVLTRTSRNTERDRTRARARACIAPVTCETAKAESSESEVASSLLPSMCSPISMCKTESRCGTPVLAPRTAALA